MTARETFSIGSIELEASSHERRREELPVEGQDGLGGFNYLPETYDRKGRNRRL